MAGKVGLTLATGLLALTGALSTPKGDLEHIVAQDAPMDVKEASTNTYQQISQNFYNIGEDFYKKGKDKDKALESLGIAAYFDSQNKQITDLVQKIEKDNKLKKNEKETKKIEEKYNKTKTETIDTLYQNGVEKAKTNKDEAQDIFHTILQVDKNSTKFDQALEKELNWKKINGYLLPPEITSAREKGMKYLNDASEGEEDKTEDDLVTTLKLENNKIFRRKSKYLNVRDTLSEESAKECHKVADATIRLLMEYLGLEGKPPYNIYRDPKSTTQYPFHRITILKNDTEFENFKKSTQWSGVSTNTNMHESWTSNKEKYVWGPGHFHKFADFTTYQKDTIAHYVLEDILFQSSHYIGSQTEKDSPWLFRFICYNFTNQLLGTTLTTKVLNRDDKYEGDVTKSTSVTSPNEMRKLAYQLVNGNKSISSNRLMRLKFDEFSENDSAMSFASAEYLLHEHKDKIVKIMSDAYKEEKSEETSIYDLKKLIAMTPEEFDKGRDEFIKRKYIGLRNYKE